MSRGDWRWRLRAFGALAVVGALAACSGSSGGTGANQPGPSTSTTSANASGDCTLSAKAVPSCGVLWGIATHPPTPARLKQAEAAIGRPVDFVYRYHDVNDVIPDAAEQAYVAEGKLLHIAIAARDFSNTTRGDITWARGRRAASSTPR